ncbi:hypothetical protein LP414_07245 [Polaromonas sp. P1(28)-13]|nr:hypothetical protein LP414_07245 [Polaromonas sp. P1(28)-13]
MPKVIAKNGDVDVLGEPGDQAKCFGQRGTAFEKQTRPTSVQAVEQRVQGPADPEVFSTF